MKRVIVHRLAAAELEKACRYYNERQPDLGFELLAEVRAALEKIADDPGDGAPFERGYLYGVVKRFPYLVYYREFDDVTHVSAIAHSARRAGYWLRRKRE